jgi:hypothetical protein
MIAARLRICDSTPRPRKAAAAAGLVLLLLGAGRAGAAEDPESVFHIDRNKNRNQVHYGIHVDANCKPVGDEPVYNYWLRLENDTPVTQPVKFFQQAAYGFRRQNIEKDGRIEVRLRALPDRQIVMRLTVVGGACKAGAFLTINGVEAHLEKVFVFADEGLFLPSVRYIELFGRSNDGHSVYEKITVGD